jgi:hypothetical protein
MTFYNQSLLAVKEGRRLLDDLNVPNKRPNDYFCENVKTDTHMNRVRYLSIYLHRYVIHLITCEITSVFMYMHMHICLYIDAYMYTYVNLYFITYVHSCKYVHIQINTYIHI